jgi:lipopolysaccharide biosynthesis glycosyltransferase
MTDITHPLIEKYAKNIGSEFMILDGDYHINTDDNLPHFRIMDLYNILDDYDRILCIDSDVIINKNIPNIFDEIPYEKIGSIFEDVGSRTADRRNILKSVQNKFGDIGWSAGYINTGFFVVSKVHKDIFTSINNGYWTGFGSDDVHLGYQINKMGIEINELSYKWNHMTMFSETWNNNADRFNSYIIHYAGNGIFDKTINNRLDQIKSDKLKIYGGNK